MENNILGNVTDKELDSLLKDAFLDTDFENNAYNRETLGVIARHTLRGNRFLPIFNVNRLDLFFLTLSFFICLNSFYRHLLISQSQVSSITDPVQHIHTFKPESIILAEPKIAASTNVSSVAVKTSLLKKKSNPPSKKITFQHLEKKEFSSQVSAQSMNTAIDSAYFIQEVKIGDVEVLIKKYRRDSLATAALPNKPVTSTLRTTSRKTDNTINKSTVKKSTLKRKNSVNRGKKVFHHRGTFILKGGRYKTSRI